MSPNRAGGRITLFLPSGETFTFSDAVVTGSTERELFIEYTSVSDGGRKVVHVQKSKIVAHSEEI